MPYDNRRATPAQRQRNEHITSRVRLRDHNYADPGYYFITSNIERRLCLLGDIADDVFHPSPAGSMVEAVWNQIPDRFPRAILDAMVVMPNHIHGLIQVPVQDDGSVHPDAPSVITIMHWFRTITTNRYIDGAKRHNWPRYPKRLWQERYIDHAVRSERALERIRAYIDANPSRWPYDEDNPSRSR